MSRIDKRKIQSLANGNFGQPIKSLTRWIHMDGFSLSSCPHDLLGSSSLPNRHRHRCHRGLIWLQFKRPIASALLGPIRAVSLGFPAPNLRFLGSLPHSMAQAGEYVATPCSSLVVMLLTFDLEPANQPARKRESAAHCLRDLHSCCLTARLALLVIVVIVLVSCWLPCLCLDS